jgi:hypothetical protein
MYDPFAMGRYCFQNPLHHPQQALSMGRVLASCLQPEHKLTLAANLGMDLNDTAIGQRQLLLQLSVGIHGSSSRLRATLTRATASQAPVSWSSVRLPQRETRESPAFVREASPAKLF